MNQLTGFLGPAYLWVKAAHLTFVIFWLAGLFLLPRFYVYHQETTVGSPEDRAWIEREARVRSIILTPAMLVVWILGLMLAFSIAEQLGSHRRHILAHVAHPTLPSIRYNVADGGPDPARTNT